MKTCCIIGHRDIEKTKELELKVKRIVTELIEKENVTEFLFGSKSDFIDFCYGIITKLAFCKISVLVFCIHPLSLWGSFLQIP